MTLPSSTSLRRRISPNTLISCGVQIIMNLTELIRFHSLIIIPFLFLFYSVFNNAVNAQPAAGDFLQDQAPGPQYLKLGPELSRPIAVVIVLLVFVFFIMVFLFVYLRHYLELNAATDALLLRAAAGSDRCGKCGGLDPSVIQTLPVVAHSAVKEMKIAKWSLECAVCLSEFQDYETLRLLPKCGHVFHPACIDAWLSSCATCPICRAMLAVGGENSASEFVSIAVVDRNVDVESEAVEPSCSEEVGEMELGGSVGAPIGGGENSGDVAVAVAVAPDY